MNIEQRKIELINWITNVQRESLIQQIEELKKDVSNDIPEEILSLLDTSNATKKNDLVEHTSSRNLLNPQ